MDQRLNTTTDILTLSEARSRLVRVRPIVERIMRYAKEAGELRADLVGDAPEEIAAENVAKLDRLRSLRRQFDHDVRKLNRYGAVLKDAEAGLIDFYGWRGEDVVFLCWRHGEDDILHWHGMHEGFAGRQGIDPTDFV